MPLTVGGADTVRLFVSTFWDPDETFSDGIDTLNVLPRHDSLP